MDENPNAQKIRINTITLKQTSQLPKQFYEDQYYLDILVNQKIEGKSSPIKINKFYTSYDVDCNVIFDDQLDTILFKLCSQKSYLPLYQGTFTTLPDDLNKKGSFEYDCDIRNSKKEKITINFTYKNSMISTSNILKSTPTKNEDSLEIFNNYQNYVEKLDKQKQEINDTIKRVSASNNVKSEVSMFELVKGKNAILFNEFTKNVDYIKSIINCVVDFLFWKDPYKTFSILSILTIFILYNFIYIVNDIISFIL